MTVLKPIAPMNDPEETTEVEEILAAARDAAKIVAEEADESSRLGHLTDRAAEAISGKILWMNAPKSRGGAEVPLHIFNRVTAEVAKGDASAAWVTGLYAGTIQMLSAFSDEAQDEVYACAKNPRGIASFNPALTQAVKVDGGYRLSGTWRFCSGQHHADYGVLWSVISGEGVAPEPAQFVVWRNEAKAADDWHVNGLAGTGSNSLILEDVFVPEHRSVRASVAAGGETASSELTDNLHFRQPLIPAFSIGSTGTALGIAEKALELFHQRIRTRGITYTPYTRQAEAVVTHLQMDEATMKLDQARFHADRGADTVIQLALDPGNLVHRVRCRADAAWTFKLCREVVELIQQASGASAISTRDPLGRMLRDVQAISVHAFLAFSSNAELHGRVLCGMDPGTPYI